LAAKLLEHPWLQNSSSKSSLQRTSSQLKSRSEYEEEGFIQKTIRIAESELKTLFQDKDKKVVPAAHRQTDSVDTKVTVESSYVSGDQGDADAQEEEDWGGMRMNTMELSSQDSSELKGIARLHSLSLSEGDRVDRSISVDSFSPEELKRGGGRGRGEFGRDRRDSVGEVDSMGMKLVDQEDFESLDDWANDSEVMGGKRMAEPFITNVNAHSSFLMSIRSATDLGVMDHLDPNSPYSPIASPASSTPSASLIRQSSSKSERMSPTLRGSPTLKSGSSKGSGKGIGAGAGMGAGVGVGGMGGMGAQSSGPRPSNLAQYAEDSDDDFGDFEDPAADTDPDLLSSLVKPRGLADLVIPALVTPALVSATKTLMNVMALKTPKNSKGSIGTPHSSAVTPSRLSQYAEEEDDDFGDLEDIGARLAPPRVDAMGMGTGGAGCTGGIRETGGTEAGADFDDGFAADSGTFSSKIHAFQKRKEPLTRRRSSKDFGQSFDSDEGGTPGLKEKLQIRMKSASK
ncbi:hypothetical protein B484DRAFT_290578, partial [Ochromonadaceae sp. CCMP2298]